MEENSSCRSRFGIFGGTFDPPHVAHVRMAKAIRDLACLERVLWIPTARSPHKLDGTIAPASTRLRMVGRAISGLEGHEVSDIEIRRGGYSYTIDTLRALKRGYPEKDLVLIMGSDQFCELSDWHEVENLIELVEICVLPRKSAIVPPPNIPFQERIKWMLAPVQESGVSSSEIRERIQQGLSFDHLVCESVGKIIREEGLYQN